MKASKASDLTDGLTKGDTGLELSELQDSTTSVNSDHLIKDVWLSNFFASMDHISKLVDNYNYISMVSRSIYPNFYNRILTKIINRTLSIPEPFMCLPTPGVNLNIKWSRPIVTISHSFRWVSRFLTSTVRCPEEKHSHGNLISSLKKSKQPFYHNYFKYSKE